MLSKEQILAADDTRPTEVSIPEWGGTVLVRMMTGTERDQYEREQYELQKIGKLGDNFRARLVVRCLVDKEGKPLFTADEVHAIGAKSSAALDRIVKAIQQVNRLDEAGIDDAVKN